MVEFAVLIPVLLLLVFGIVQFAIGFNRVQGLHAAAREGARTASIPTNGNADIEARVTDALAGINFDNSPSISIQPGPCLNRAGQQVTVTVAADHTISIPFFPNQTLNLEGQGVFRCE